MKDSEDNIIFAIEAEGACSHEKILDIDSSLPGVGVEWEESVEFGDVLSSEDGVFSSDVFGKDCLEIFGLNFLFAHWILIMQYDLISTGLFSDAYWIFGYRQPFLFCVISFILSRVDNLLINHSIHLFIQNKF